MKVTKSYKQPCPSCGAGVPIKDPKLVGKKVDCPECKFRFVVEPPREQPDDEPDKAKKKKPAGKHAKAKDAKGKVEKAGKEKDAAGKEGDGKKKKKPAKAPLASKKLQLGLAAGVVGLLVLAVAAYLIMSGNPTPSPAPNPNQAAVNPNPEPEPMPMPEPMPEPAKDAEKLPEKPVPMDPPTVVRNVLPPATDALTNILPNDTEHVSRVFFKNAQTSVAGLAAKEAFPGVDTDNEFRQRVGIPLSAIDNLLRAERFTAPAWSYTLVHLTEAVDEAALVKALDLKEEPPIKNRKLYTTKQTGPWVQQLARLSPGTPENDRLQQRSERPLYVHIYDEQTVVFADKAPVTLLLEKEGHFPYAGSGEKGELNFGVPFGATTYLSLKPELKETMDRMEQDAAETVLFSSATLMDAARINADADPRSPGRIAWQLRQLWDVSHLLDTNRARVKLLGTALYQKEPRNLQLRNEIRCRDELDAKSLEKELQDRTAPLLASFLERVLDTKIKVPVRPEVKTDGENPLLPMMPPEGQPTESSEETKVSEIRVSRDSKAVDFQLELALDNSKYARLYNATALMLFSMRSELQLATRQLQRDKLARAGQEMSDRGLAARKFDAGQYPPGVFKRPASTIRTTNQPNQRLSWMTALLPFLGHNSLYRRIDFNGSWQDPSNWMAARTLVPEFLDPMYPDHANYVKHPGLTFHAAGTHFVGIAGVGLDAASYPRDDPAFAGKRGVLGYERSASLEEVRTGRGQANTVLMMQVPHDGPAGVTPWIAGGGATLRGVPETKSIEPFLLGRDRHGKQIMHGDKRGAFAMMADGSVRFIHEGISDEVFKAMCTVQGPPPAGFDAALQANTTVVNPAPTPTKTPAPEKTAAKE